MNTASCPNQPCTRVVTYSLLLSVATCQKYVAFKRYASQFWFKFNQSALRRFVLPCSSHPHSGLSVPPSSKRGQVLVWTFSDHQGRREGARGHVLLPYSQCWNFFSLNSAEFVTLNRIFSMFIGFLGASPLDPIQGSDHVWALLGTDGTPFVPLRNKFLVTPLQTMPLYYASWWKILVPICLDNA